MSCSAGHRCSSDLTLLWLWQKLAATALIRPVAWEPPYAKDKKTKKKKKKKKERKRKRKLHIQSNHVVKEVEETEAQGGQVQVAVECKSQVSTIPTLALASTVL